MSTNQLNVLVSLMIIPFFVLELTNGVEVPQIRAEVPQRYCGEKLSNALSIVCEGKYNSPNHNREYQNDEPIHNNLTIAQHHVKGYSECYSPFQRALRARAQKMNKTYKGRCNQKKRQKRDITDECCAKKCNTSVPNMHLGMFCAHIAQNMPKCMFGNQ
ncbi:uncharacterized protein LOC105255165 [Camponotus floridanus]|uniref:uncharacterized protein LOC105255165 n=1 Tax=Camponotus floridanus TaxID=104421 RepID=UPI00059C642A|nr:uncharacterized protein LOC105255165 [Camponotus floridanus]